MREDGKETAGPDNQASPKQRRVCIVLNNNDSHSVDCALCLYENNSQQRPGLICTEVIRLGVCVRV